MVSDNILVDTLLFKDKFRGIICLFSIVPAAAIGRYYAARSGPQNAALKTV
jgi:hypothetical protein